MTATIGGWRRRLPSLLAACWATAGAALALSALYSHQWFRWEAWEGISQGSDACSGGSAVVAGFEVYRDRAPPGEAGRIVDLWHCATIAALALAGAAVGSLLRHVGRKRLSADPLIDLRLWLVTSFVLFAILFRYGLPGEHWSLFREVQSMIDEGGLRSLEWELKWLIRPAIEIWVAAAVVGWAVHVVLASQGVRLRRKSYDQAADYDDRAVPRPPDMPHG